MLRSLRHGRESLLPGHDVPLQIWVNWRRAVRDGLRQRSVARSRKVEEIIGALWESETEVFDAVEIVVAQGL